jgi:hypothetical protein
MIAEGTAVGLVFAIWWRSTHANEKAQYDKYYANLRGAWISVGSNGTQRSLSLRPCLSLSLLSPPASFQPLQLL